MSKDTFEQTYPLYPFSPLVTLGIELSKWFAAGSAADGAQKSSQARRATQACR